MRGSDLRSKLKNALIFAKKLSVSSLPGDYTSAFKGSGLEFDQLREYTPGDDIRIIDWNATAKMNKPMVKQFVQERDRTVIFAIDTSKSGAFSSTGQSRWELAQQVTMALGFVASKSKDRVGALFFSDKIEQWIPPARGNVHFGRVAKALFSKKPERGGTNLGEAFKFLVNLKLRNAILLVVSDWIDEVPRYEKFFKIASCEYDMIAVRLVDHTEQAMPAIGMLEVEDIETGERAIVDTTSGKLNSSLLGRLIEHRRLCGKLSVDHLSLSVGEPFVPPLVSFLRQRISRQV
ncbi:DUF58 domain-containing protein [bacterium]|nr:DUF58 domain-containing protein [bacterium]